MRTEIKEGKLELGINISDIISHMSDEDVGLLLDIFIFEKIIGAVEQQLKGKSSCWSFDSTGYRHGSKLREEILKIQGIEPEYKKDLESRIRSLETDCEHYKKFYDWYFKVYHHERGELFKQVINSVGDVGR